MWSPNAAFAVLAAGVAGGVWELLQPGRFVPGVLGLGAAATGIYWLGRNHPSSLGLVLIGFSFLVIAGSIAIHSFAARLTVVALSATALSAGFILLFPAPLRIAPVLAVPVCTAFSFIAAGLLHTATLGCMRKRA